MTVIEVVENGKTYIVHLLNDQEYPNPPYIKFLKDFEKELRYIDVAGMTVLMPDSELEALSASVDPDVVAFRELIAMKGIFDRDDQRFQQYLNALKNKGILTQETIDRIIG